MGGTGREDGALGSKERGLKKLSIGGVAADKVGTRGETVDVMGNIVAPETTGGTSEGKKV